MPAASYGQQMLQYMNYGEWVSASAEERAYYIAGMIDGYLVTCGRGEELRRRAPRSTCKAAAGCLTAVSDQCMRRSNEIIVGGRLLRSTG
jgi:hypothetical protein